MERNVVWFSELAEELTAEEAGVYVPVEEAGVVRFHVKGVYSDNVMRHIRKHYSEVQGVRMGPSEHHGDNVFLAELQWSEASARDWAARVGRRGNARTPYVCTIRDDMMPEAVFDRMADVGTDLAVVVMPVQVNRATAPALFERCGEAAWTWMYERSHEYNGRRYQAILGMRGISTFVVVRDEGPTSLPELEEQITYETLAASAVESLPDAPDGKTECCIVKLPVEDECVRPECQVAVLVPEPGAVASCHVVDKGDVFYAGSNKWVACIMAIDRGPLPAATCLMDMVSNAKVLVDWFRERPAMTALMLGRGVRVKEKDWGQAVMDREDVDGCPLDDPGPAECDGLRVGDVVGKPSWWVDGDNGQVLVSEDPKAPDKNSPKAWCDDCRIGFSDVGLYNRHLCERHYYGQDGWVEDVHVQTMHMDGKVVTFKDLLNARLSITKATGGGGAVLPVGPGRWEFARTGFSLRKVLATFAEVQHNPPGTCGFFLRDNPGLRTLPFIATENDTVVFGKPATGSGRSRRRRGRKRNKGVDDDGEYDYVMAI
jgi:hypothetical protein